MWEERRVLGGLTAFYGWKDQEAREKQQTFNKVAVAYDQKRQEAVVWGLWALGLEKEEEELMKQLVQLGDQGAKEPCAAHFRKYQEAANMRWVASGLEEEMYQLRDQVVHWCTGALVHWCSLGTKSVQTLSLVTI